MSFSCSKQLAKSFETGIQILLYYLLYYQGNVILHYLRRKGEGEGEGEGEEEEERREMERKERGEEEEEEEEGCLCLFTFLLLLCQPSL